MSLTRSHSHGQTERRETDGTVEYLPGILDVLTKHSNLFEQLVDLSRNGVLQRGTTPLIIPPSGGKITSSAGRFYGYSLRDNNNVGGTVVRLRDGVETGQGDVLASFALAQGADRNMVWDKGISYASGIFVEIVSGSLIDSAIYTGPR